MVLDCAAELTATDFSKNPGRALDAAANGPVRVRRRGETFVLLRERQLDELVQDAADPRPKTLEDMLAGYDPQVVHAELRGWLDDPAAGREGL